MPEKMKKKQAYKRLIEKEEFKNKHIHLNEDEILYCDACQRPVALSGKSSHLKEHLTTKNHLQNVKRINDLKEKSLQIV
jgi:hypothetical protein